MGEHPGEKDRYKHKPPTQGPGAIGWTPSFSPTHVPAGWRTDTMAGQELGQPPEIMRLTIHAAWVSDTFTVSTFKCLGAPLQVIASRELQP